MVKNDKNDADKIDHGLEPMQEAFAREWVICSNATQAAIKAGYSEDTAKQQGSRLLTNVDVRAFIDKLKTERAAALGFQAIDLLWKLQEVIDFDPLDFFDSRGDIKPLDQIPLELRRLITGVKQTKFGAEYQIMSREKAIEMLARHHTLFNDKVEIKHDYADMPPEQLDAMLAEKIAAMNAAKEQMD